MKHINATGLACPGPVLAAKEAIENNNPKSITISVDNEAARENVARFLTTQGYEISVEQKEGEFQVHGKNRSEKCEVVESQKETDEDLKRTLVMITTDRMGYGDDGLGLKLMINFIKTIKEMGTDLWRLVFVNNGVKLTVDGSEVLDALKELESNEVHILVCGTCLDHFSLLEKKQVGSTTNMLDIVMAMQFADKVIHL
jgi:selenium metabolism protein YedF